MKPQQIDNTALIETTGSLLVARINSLGEPGAKVGTGMAVTFNTLTTTAAMIMRGFNPHQNKFPTNDHILLVSFLVYEGCSLSSDASAHVEFSMPRLLDALHDFERFTGRNGEHLVNETLLETMKRETAVDASKFGPNSKFLQ